MHTGADYLVNIQKPSSRTFTVAFLSKQANSTENGIQLADDDIVEGAEAFRLRIVAARFIGEAAAIFRAQDGLNNTIADVTIEDDDCKFMNRPWIICLQTVRRKTYACIHVMHAASPPTVIVYFAMLYINLISSIHYVLVHCFLIAITPWALCFHSVNTSRSLSLPLYIYICHAVGL